MKTILIVDDEHDISMAVETLLSYEGYEVVTAKNGKEAMERLAEKRPDLILLDVMMPVMDGLETLQALKQDPEYSSIPVVMMSAVHPSMAKSSHRPEDFISKPFDIDRLLAIVEKMLGDGRA